MVRIDRRRLLKLSGAGAAAAASGGLAGILASGRAPAYAQQAKCALAALVRLSSPPRTSCC